MSNTIPELLKNILPDGAVVDRMYSISLDQSCIEFRVEENNYRVILDKLDLSKVIRDSIVVYNDSFGNWEEIITLITNRTGLELIEEQDYVSVNGRPVVYGFDKLNISSESVWYKGYLTVKVYESSDKLPQLEQPLIPKSSTTIDNKIKAILITTLFHSDEKMFIENRLTEVFRDLIINRLRSVFKSVEIKKFIEKLPFSTTINLFNDEWSDIVVISMDGKTYPIRFTSTTRDLPDIPEAVTQPDLNTPIIEVEI